LNELLWQQISKKLNDILDRWKALGKYFHLASIWYFYLFSFGNGISSNDNFAFSFSQSLCKKSILAKWAFSLEGFSS